MLIKLSNGLLEFNPSEYTKNYDISIKKHVANLFDLEEDEFYLTQGGKLIGDKSLQNVQQGPVQIVPRLLGGKGGFGSMLRAIGAQIEKTTNRDACRDLSGRRLRDINEEQRLKRWFAKQSEREQEKAETKKRKLEKLKKLTEGPPLPVIDDQQYNKQRAEMADSVYEAVDKGFDSHDVPSKASSSATSSDESSSDSPAEGLTAKLSTTSAAPGSSSYNAAAPSSSSASNSKSSEAKKKPTFKKLMLDEDLDTGSSSDDSSDEDETSPKKAKLG